MNLHDVTVTGSSSGAKVFDKDAQQGCPIDDFLTDHDCCFCDNIECVDGDDEADKKQNKAISQNWRCDPAIESERVEKVRLWAKNNTIHGQLDALNKLQDYVLNRDKSTEPFYRADSNSNNLIFRNSFIRRDIYFKPGQNDIVYETKLFRILPLHESVVNLFKTKLRYAVNQTQTDFDWPSQLYDLNDLYGMFANADQQQRIKMVNWILKKYTSDQRRQFDPWWATLRQNVNQSDLLSANWRNINDQLGLGFLNPAKPLIGIEYPVSCLDSLYRPTSIEAGSYAYFHPAEPGLHHGRTMPLSATAQSAPEFIHGVLKELTYDDCAVYVGWSDHNNDDYLNDILDHRNQHQQSVLKNDSSECADWAKQYW